MYSFFVLAEDIFDPWQNLKYIEMFEMLVCF